MPSPVVRFQPGTPSVPCIGGVNASTMRDSLKALCGDDALARALATLPVDQREELDGLSALRWVRDSTMDALVRAAAEDRSRGYESLYDEVMRHGGQRWFKLAWRALLGLASDEALVSRSGMVFARSRNCGTLVGRLVGVCRAELTLTEWPGVPARHARNFSIGIETILAASGRHEARVRWEPTPDGALFTATWRK